MRFRCLIQALSALRHMCRRSGVNSRPNALNELRPPDCIAQSDSTFFATSVFALVSSSAKNISIFSLTVSIWLFKGRRLAWSSMGCVFSRCLPVVSVIPSFNSTFSCTKIAMGSFGVSEVGVALWVLVG